MGWSLTPAERMATNPCDVTSQFLKKPAEPSCKWLKNSVHIIQLNQLILCLLFMGKSISTNTERH